MEQEQKQIKVTKKQSVEKPQVKQDVDLNELTFIVKNAQGHELINEKGSTVVGMLMQKDGKILTSFLGDYNKEILSTLKKVNHNYFKSLTKKLYSKTSNLAGQTKSSVSQEQPKDASVPK